MNSFLIIGGTNKERLEKADLSLITYHLSLNTNHPDLFIIEPELSISIKQIREIQKFLSRKPYQAEIKAVIMPEAEKMTIPAQNSFLKTLEEPPKNSLIILCAKNTDQLIATIVSRCQLIKLIPKPQIEVDKSLITNHQSLITKIAKASPGQRLNLIEPYTKSREEAIKFCEEMIVVLRRDIACNIRNIKKFQFALQLLNSNINVKLAMDNLIINL